jgi:hypothetical protein
VTPREDIAAWLKAEAHVMPVRKRRQFCAFIDSVNPPQYRLPLQKGKGVGSK